MKFFFYANYLNSNLEAENFVQKLKNFINCVLVKFFKVLTEKKVNFILLQVVKNKIKPSRVR